MKAIMATVMRAEAKKRAGFGVICRRAAATDSQGHRTGSGIQVLIQKRGHRLSFGGKWSFPGGGLDRANDEQHSWLAGIMREIFEEAGAGTPAGIPPLYPVSFTQNGRFYFWLLALDPAANGWQPAAMSRYASEIDTTQAVLNLCGHAYRTHNGYCWVDWLHLNEAATSEPGSADQFWLHPGVVEWMIAHGRSNHESLYNGFDLAVPVLADTTAVAPSWRSTDRYETPYVSSLPTSPSSISAIPISSPATSSESSTSSSSSPSTTTAVAAAASSSSTSSLTVGVISPVPQPPLGTRLFFAAAAVTSSTFTSKSSSHTSSPSSSHVSSAAAATAGGSGSGHTPHRTSTPCRYASSCRDRACRFVHATADGTSPARHTSSSTAISPATAIAIPSSSSLSTPLRSTSHRMMDDVSNSVSATLCRYGDACRDRTRCRFVHPVSSSPPRDTHNPLQSPTRTDIHHMMASLAISQPGSNTNTSGSNIISNSNNGDEVKGSSINRSLSTRTCQYGASCHRLDCRYVHPLGTTTATTRTPSSSSSSSASAAATVVTAAHDGDDITIRVCRYGAACRKGVACRYIHPVAATLTCLPPAV